MAEFALDLNQNWTDGYELDVKHTGGNTLAKIQLTFYVVDGPFPGNLTNDQIADGFRDWIATLPNYASSTLERITVGRTIL